MFSAVLQKLGGQKLEKTIHQTHMAKQLYVDKWTLPTHHQNGWKTNKQNPKIEYSLECVAKFYISIEFKNQHSWVWKCFMNNHEENENSHHHKFVGTRFFFL